MKTGLFAVDIVNKPTNLSPYSDLNSQETNLTRSSNNKINPVSLKLILYHCRKINIGKFVMSDLNRMKSSSLTVIICIQSEIVYWLLSR